jgi:hypothetical protein
MAKKNLAKQKIPTKSKDALELAIKNALKIAYVEKRLLLDYYSEENLRYTVMTEISKVNHFGTFPNSNDHKHHLCFQRHYEHVHLDDSNSKLIPDIVSLRYLEKGIGYSVNSPLVIELKKDGNITSKKIIRTKDLHKRIKKLGSCIEADLLKNRIYLTKRKDTFTFEYGVVINLVSEHNESYLTKLEEMLIRQQREFNLIKSIDSHKNLLFAWFNPFIKEPELIWLNQREPIALKK